jgi:hypothetical protein
MPPIKSKVSRDLSQFLCSRFLKPELLKANKNNYKFWPREIKIIGKLFTNYPNEEFWITLNVTFFLNSFAYFLTGDGKNELEKQWRLFCINKKIDSKQLDKETNLSILELSKDNNPQPKKTVVDWVDN